MSNSNSLTRQVQLELENIQNGLIASGNMELKKLQSDIREFLKKSEYINTFGFQLRRHIQVEFQEFFKKEGKYDFVIGKDYIDLLNGGNISWPDDVVNVISKRLAQYYGTANGSLGKKEVWERYLKDESIPNTREIIFSIAFTLKMGVEATILLFISCGMEAYNVRNPQDFIFYFCARRSEKVHFNEASYGWKDANALWNRYIEEVYKPSIDSSIDINSSNGTDGYTMVLSNTLSELINSTEPTNIVEDKLFEYLNGAKDEFVACKENRWKKYVPEDAYSNSNYKNFMRLTKYLYVLYPNIPHIITQTVHDFKDVENIFAKSKIEDTNKEYSYFDYEYIPVKLNNDIPELEDLAKAIIKTNLEHLGSFSSEECIIDTLNLVESLKEEFKSIQKKKNITRDVLLIVVLFFLLEYYNNTSYDKQDKLIELAEENICEIDTALLDIIDGVYEDIDIYDKKKNMEKIMQDINYFLRTFHLPEVYLPNKIDRLVIATLLPANLGEAEDTLDDVREIMNYVFLADKE